MLIIQQVLFQSKVEATPVIKIFVPSHPSHMISQHQQCFKFSLYGCPVLLSPWVTQEKIHMWGEMSFPVVKAGVGRAGSSISDVFSGRSVSGKFKNEVRIWKVVPLTSSSKSSISWKASFYPQRVHSPV